MQSHKSSLLTLISKAYPDFLKINKFFKIKYLNF